jgi:hypothetical protein
MKGNGLVGFGESCIALHSLRPPVSESIRKESSTPQIVSIEFAMQQDLNEAEDKYKSIWHSYCLTMSHYH